MMIASSLECVKIRAAWFLFIKVIFYKKVKSANQSDKFGSVPN